MGVNDPRDLAVPERKAAAPMPTKDQDQDQAGDRPEPTHDLLLSDGSTVEHSGGIPTHYGREGGPALRVLQAIERQV